MLKIFFAIIIIAGLFQNSQNAKRNEENAYVDSHRPLVYLTFEKYDKGDSGKENESANVILLKLHNNSKWAINIRTTSLYIGADVSALKLNNGKTVFALKDGLEIAPQYYIEGYPSLENYTNAQGEVTAKLIEPQRSPFYFWGDVSSTAWIPSNSAVSFNIPRQYLTNYHRLYIIYNFEWEKPDSELEHRVYFYGNSLVKN